MSSFLAEYTRKLREVESATHSLRRDLKSLDNAGKKNMFSLESNFYADSNKIITSIYHIENDLSLLEKKVREVDQRKSSFRHRQDRDFVVGRKGSILDSIERTRNGLNKLKSRYKSVARNTDKISSRSLFNQTLQNAGDPAVDIINHRPDQLQVDVFLGLAMIIGLAFRKK